MDTVMKNNPTDIYGYINGIAYQSIDTISRNNPKEHSTNLAEFSYQQQETKLKPLIYVEEPTVTDTTVSKGLVWIKLVLNIIRFAFSGKSYLFDGQSFKEVAFPHRTVYPVAVSINDFIAVAGGLKEDGTALESVLSFGDTVYVYIADSDYQCFVVGETDVYVIDDNNSVRATIVTGSTPLLKRWMLISRKPFKAVLMRLT